ncbi:MAG TPA: DUF883 domain-containing protein [Noviherbaspirillum sp.]
METNYSSQATGNGSDKTTTGTQGTRSSTFTEAKPSGQRTAASLRSDLSNLKNDLDALVNRSASLSDEELRQAHTQLMAKFSSMRYAAKGIASEASRQINRGVETTTEYVKDKPMQSVAAAVGAGLLLGMLFKRR